DTCARTRARARTATAAAAPPGRACRARRAARRPRARALAQEPDASSILLSQARILAEFAAQGLQQPAQRARPVAENVFLLQGQLGGCHAQFGQIEIGVVAKAVAAPWRIQDFAVPGTLDHDRTRIVGAADIDQDG